MIDFPYTRYISDWTKADKTKGFTTLSAFEYVKILEDSLSESLFQRLNNNFLGLIIKATLRNGLGFSGQIVHHLLSRQIITTRSNELWFHFAGQPMRFSLREFYLATGLSFEETDSDPSEEEAGLHWQLIEYE